jgi:hypothetical protein
VCNIDVFHLSVSFNTLFAFFDCYKVGPEVVSTTRWRSTAEMTSSFDSPTPILFRRSVENFRLSLTVQQLFVCIDLAVNLASGLQRERGREKFISQTHIYK